jgi:hypothetical protein
MKAKQAKQKAITEAEVQEALRNFKERGGLVKKLPDEIVPTHNLVGARWAVYEPVQEASGSGATSAAAESA